MALTLSRTNRFAFKIPTKSAPFYILPSAVTVE